MGRIEPRKGQDVFLRSAAILAKQVPEMHFAVVGPSMRSYDREYKELTARLDIEERVVFTGARKDVNNVMAAFDILAVPSLEEAYGLVAVEGMLTGLPVVAARAGALPEFIEDSKTGLLVKVSDPAELAEALMRLARNAGMRDSLGRQARHWAFENLSLERALYHLDSLYEECLSQK